MTMKPSEIRELTDAELERSIAEGRRELLNLRIQAKTGQLENSAKIGQARRDLARVLTVLGAGQGVGEPSES